MSTDVTKPTWVTELCNSMVKELTSVLTTNPMQYVQGANQFKHVDEDQRQQTLVRCFQSGWLDHMKKGCRNPPAPQAQGNDNLPPMRVSPRQ